MRTWRNKLKAARICGICGKNKLLDRKSSCEACRIKVKKRLIKSKRKMQKNLKDPAYMAAINEKIRIGLAKGL